MTAFFSSINLPNIKVTDQETLDNGDIIVRVECLENGTHCKCCGKHIIKRHSLNKIIRLKHLPSCGDDVYIESQLLRNLLHLGPPLLPQGPPHQNQQPQNLQHQNPFANDNLFK